MRRMDLWVMWTLGAGLALLPLVLMWLFNGSDRADSRGRRTSRRWRTS
jgi:hypothetical protein